MLAAAGVDPAARHVALGGADHAEEAVPPQRYDISIPLAKALRPEVLLAWEMNGEPLTPVHGAPLRAVVPGYIGARSVKWLERVELRREPSDGYYQATAYRLLPEDGVPAPGVGIALGEVALNSDILAPGDGDRLPAGTVELCGYAFAGGDRSVARVEVCADGGRTGPPPSCSRTRASGRGGCGARRSTLARRAATTLTRARLGQRGGDAARARRDRLEPEGLRQQRVGAGHGRS